MLKLLEQLQIINKFLFFFSLVPPFFVFIISGKDLAQAGVLVTSRRLVTRCKVLC